MYIILPIDVQIFRKSLYAKLFHIFPFQIVHITYRSFKVEDGIWGVCLYDHVVIMDPLTQSVTVHCGTLVDIPVITATGNKFVMTFSSDDSVVKPGFTAYFWSTPTIPTTTPILTQSETSEITSTQAEITETTTDSTTDSTTTVAYPTEETTIHQETTSVILSALMTSTTETNGETGR